MTEITTMTDTEIKLCYNQYLNREWGTKPLKDISEQFKGQLGAVQLQIHLLEEIARRFCKQD